MKNKALDNFASQMLDSAIQGINQAAAAKQKEVNYWKEKAYSLAAKYQACYLCLSDKDWIPKTLTCQTCQLKEKEIKESTHE